VAFRDDLLTHRCIEGPVQVVEQQRTGIVCRQPVDHQCRLPCQDVVADAGASRARERDSFGQEAPRYESDDLR